MIDHTRYKIVKLLTSLPRIIEGIEEYNGQLWWKVGSSQTDTNKNGKILSINDQISVPVALMVNLFDRRWASQLKIH